MKLFLCHAAGLAPRKRGEYKFYRAASKAFCWKNRNSPNWRDALCRVSRFAGRPRRSVTLQLALRQSSESKWGMSAGRSRRARIVGETKREGELPACPSEEGQPGPFRRTPSPAQAGSRERDTERVVLPPCVVRLNQRNARNFFGSASLAGVGGATTRNAASSSAS